MRIHKLFFCFFLFANITFGQSVSFETVIGLRSEKYIQETNIRKIIQDKYGFKWFATQESAIRFDGQNVNRFTSSVSIDKYRLTDIDIWDLEEDTAKNEIFALTSFGSIDVLSTITGSVIRRIMKPSGQEANWFMDIILTPKHIWLNSFNGVWVYDRIQNRFTQILENKSSNPSPLITKKIFKDNNDYIWTFNKTGKVTIYNDDIIIQNPNGQSIGDSLFTDNLLINDIVSIDKTLLFIATSKGILACNYKTYGGIQITHNPLKQKFLFNIPVEALYKYNNSLFVATDGLYKVSLKTEASVTFKDRYLETQTDWFSSIQNMFIDNNELMWLGGRNGLSYFNIGEKAFTSLYKSAKTNLGLEHVIFVLPSDSTSYYACCKAGLYSINNHSEIKVLSKEIGYNYLFKTDKETYIVSNQKGLKILKSDVLVSIESIYNEFKPYRNFSVNSHIFFNDSLVAIGTESFNGILIWNRKQKIIRNIIHDSNSGSLASNVVNTICKYNDSSIIILSDKSLALYNIFTGVLENLTIRIKTAGEPVGILFDIAVRPDFNLVAAYGVGIIKTDKNFKVLKIYSTENGLSNNGVYKVFPAQSNSVLVTTNNGLNLINLDDDKIRKYYSDDGLHSNIFEEACGVANGNSILAGGIKGFTTIFPSKIRMNIIAPVLYVSKIVCEYPDRIRDSTDIMSKKFVVSNNILQTTIYFSAISWNHIDRNTFAYRITEKGENWIQIQTQNFVTLISQPPGTYHLQVKAANEDGVWSEPKELILIFEPKWYQTKGFYLLIVLTVAAILYALYRYRIRQIKKQYQIRKNIATDLHDDLGSTLNSVKVFTNLAISGVKQEESLQQVKDNLTEATMSLRDMIWVLDDSLDTVDELVTRLKQFALPITAASNMEFLIIADSDVNSRTLTKEEKRNLFLICKETINNSIKYSGATQIKTDILAAGKKIQITIADNGKGFDEATVKKGYGLKNMQYRAGQIKYKVALATAPGNGTQITILPS